MSEVKKSKTLIPNTVKNLAFPPAMLLASESVMSLLPEQYETDLDLSTYVASAVIGAAVGVLENNFRKNHPSSFENKWSEYPYEIGKVIGIVAAGDYLAQKFTGAPDVSTVVYLGVAACTFATKTFIRPMISPVFSKH